MKKGILLFILCLVCCSVYSQSNYYHFSQSYAPYTSLSGDTVAMPSDWVNGIEYTSGLSGTAYRFFGKTFHFNDKNIRLSYTSDGNLIVQDDTSQFVFSILETSYDSIDAQTAISFKQTSGAAGDILALQWRNIKVHSGPIGNFTNFQIFFNLTTGVAEFHYGSSSANNATGYPNTSGPRVGLAYFNKITAQNYERIVLSGQPSAIPTDTTKTTVLVDSSTSAPAYTLTGVPPSGTIYRFTPRQLPTGLSGLSGIGYTAQIMPNPFSASFVIQSIKPQAFTITDAIGRQMQSGFCAGRSMVDASQWPSGLYLIRFDDSSIKKLLKQ